MSDDKSFGMKKLPGALSQHMEEQIGLLQTPTNDSRDSMEYHDDQELQKDKHQLTHHHKPRRRRIQTIAITFLLVCTVLFLTHLVATHRKHDQTLYTAPARLRPEEDYILDPGWDFNAAPTTREYNWIIDNHQLNPDGVYRPMVLINSAFPGPLIACNEGDELVVHVQNHASNSTSIHWHGLFQNGTNFMDGTIGVTQCPIAPGHSFTYRFNVSGQTGTYFYHSHVSMQASDGLVGPLVIHPRGDERKNLQKAPYEQDRVVLLSDHYYDLSSSLLLQYLAPGSENDEPVPPSALINGRSVRNCSDLPNRNCSSIGISNAMFYLSSISSTRLRVINVGAFAEFSLQIDEHEFQVAEVDGTEVQPQSIHRLNINPAQRYSIVVTPPSNDNNELYWMRARMTTHCFAYEEPELQEEVWGVIRYKNQSGKATAGDKDIQTLTPQSRDWPEIIEVECRDLNTSTLEPVIPIAAPATVDHFIPLRSSFQIRDWRLSRGYLNDTSFRINASQPILNTLLDSDNEHQPDSTGINTVLFDPKNQLVYQTTGISTVDILIQNFDDGAHPFHLHGYKFWILAEGHGYPPPTPELHASLNLTNPLRRDTASIEAYGWMLIRFVADNPGVWAFHCHIGWHAEAGLMMVFATRMEDMEGMDEAREVGKLCGIEGRERGMGPSDAIWVGQPS